MKGLGLDKTLKFGSCYINIYKEQRTGAMVTNMINYSWPFLAERLDKKIAYIIH